MSKNNSSISAFSLNIFFWIGFVLYISLFNKQILMATLKSLDENFFVYSWNMFFAVWSTHCIVRLLVLPVWRLLFIDTNKFGQKLEWYDDMYKHLTPSNELSGTRWRIIILLAIFCYLTRFLPFDIFQVYSLQYAKIRHANSYSLLVANYFTHKFLFLSYISPFITIVWSFLSFEGRTRLIARTIDRKLKLKWREDKNSDLPTNPFNKNSKEFNISIFSSFLDQKGNISKSLKEKEEWVL